MAVLDSSAFFIDLPEGEANYTTPSVVSELIDISSRCRYEKMIASGLSVQEPSADARKRVNAAALQSGDADVLSVTDIDILALALDLGADLVTDDFAVQNVARVLSVKTRPLQQRHARFIKWRFRCVGCGRYFKQEGDCPVCGSIIKRKLK
jgi:endoribonuclease Nob1